MFNADITWTPVAEKRATAPPKQQALSSNRDSSSVSSASTSWSSKIKQWSKVRNGKSSSQQELDGSSIGNLQAVQSGLIPTSLPIPGPRVDFRETKARAVTCNPAGLDELYELPGIGMRLGSDVGSPLRASSPRPRSYSNLSGSTEVWKANILATPC
jgi:hypothetical protein